MFHFKEVVEEVEFPDNELTLEQGYEFDSECEIGDSLGIRIDTEEFGRIAAQSAKTGDYSKNAGRERNAVYENFIHKKVKSSTELSSGLTGQHHCQSGTGGSGVAPQRADAQGKLQTGRPDPCVCAGCLEESKGLRYCPGPIRSF